MGISLNKSVFESLDKNIQERILATGCIERIGDEDPETVSASLPPPAGAAQTESSADINEEYDYDESGRLAEEEEEYQESLEYNQAAYDYDELEEDNGDPRPLDDDEWARSHEEGWPYD